LLTVAVKQLINKACQLKLQLGLFGVTCLFINYNIKANKNGLENHIRLHIWRVYVTTVCLNKPFKGEMR